MKKLISLVTAGAMLTSLAACSSKSSSSLQPTTDENGRTVITIGMSTNYPVLV